jgi:hypothetical protein
MQNVSQQQDQWNLVWSYCLHSSFILLWLYKNNIWILCWVFNPLQLILVEIVIRIYGKSNIIEMMICYSYRWSTFNTTTLSKIWFVLLLFANGRLLIMLVAFTWEAENEAVKMKSIFFETWNWCFIQMPGCWHNLELTLNCCKQSERNNVYLLKLKCLSHFFELKLNSRRDDVTKWYDWVCQWEKDLIHEFFSSVAVWRENNKINSLWISFCLRTNWFFEQRKKYMLSYFLDFSNCQNFSTSKWFSFIFVPFSLCT